MNYPLKGHLLVLLSLLGGPLLAQTTEAARIPDETELILPEVTIKVDDLTSESLVGLFAKTLDLPLPEITIPLPDQGQLPVPEVSLPLPSPGLTNPPPATTAAAGSFPVYSQGVIGAGSSNFVHGALSLLKLGQAPRFALNFLHETMDGYWDGAAYRSGGTYTAQRRDQLDLDLQGQWGPGDLRAVTSYREGETGFQGLSAAGYQSALERRWTLTADWTAVLGNHEFKLGLGAANTARVLTSSTPLTLNELQPQATGSWKYLWSADNTVALQTGWNLTGLTNGNQLTDQHRQSWSLDSRLRLILSPGLSLNATAGGSWDLGNLWTWNLTGETIYQRDNWGLGLSGLWQQTSLDYTGLWQLSPQAAWPTTVSLYNLRPSLISAGLWGQLRPRADLSFKLTADYRTWTHRLQTGSRDQATGLINLVFDSNQLVVPQLSATWTPLPELLASLSWSTEWPNHHLGAETSWTAAGDSWGTKLVADWGIDTSLAAAQLDLTAWWTLVKGIRFEGAVHDPLSLTMKAGRTGAGNYLEPGFQVRFFTKITL